MDYPTFSTIYSEFSAVPQVKVQYVLNNALNRIDATEWGNYADEAQGLLAAHMLASLPGAPGAAAQISGYINNINLIDDFQIESTIPLPKDPDAYDLTAYGRQFKQLRDSVLLNITVSANCLAYLNPDFYTPYADQFTEVVVVQQSQVST